MSSDTSSYLINLNTRKNESFNLPKGHSLFLPIPNRNCASANIPEYLCSCALSLTIDTNEKIIKDATLYVIDYINDVLLKQFSDICMQLSFKNVTDAQILQQGAAEVEYSIIFETYPNEARFDAKFQVDDLDGSFKLVGNIVRINSYGLSSKCIEDYQLRNFCYCYSYDIEMRAKKQRLPL